MIGRRFRAGLALLGAVVLIVSGCGRGLQAHTQPAGLNALPSASAFAALMRDRVTADAMMRHLAELQNIADANAGNRAMGTTGYDASVDYVADALRGKGFDVQTPAFEVRLPFAEEPVVTVGGVTVAAEPLLFTIGTPPAGVSGHLVAARPGDAPGCTASDYDGLTVTGAVVLVDRGQCEFAAKQAAAAERGALALIVVNNEDGDEMGGTLGGDTAVKIPVVIVDQAEGQRMRKQPGHTTLKLNAGVRTQMSRNVIAQTTTGSTSDVVILGAHLDSAPKGPGINDNGSGVAAVLETALQLGSSPPVRNAVRFGFWGAEEFGILGSTDYVESLDIGSLKDIALYLNFDMVGSPNPGYFTYDGDQSAPPDPRQDVPRVPEGSPGIERTLVEYLNGAGKPPQDIHFDGQSDYDAFTRAGVPAGGLFTGAVSEKTHEQVQLWGGEAGQPFDTNYHKDTDTLDRVDRSALLINGAGAAYAVGLYAQDLSGRNGVPVRADRTRHTLATS